MNKVIKFFYDLETTGTDVRKHGIHHISGFIEINDKRTHLRPVQFPEIRQGNNHFLPFSGDSLGQVFLDGTGLHGIPDGQP